MSGEDTRRGTALDEARRMRWIGWGVAILASAGAYVALGSLDRPGVTGGILLLVVALAGLGVAVGSTGRPEAGEAEGVGRATGALDLSGRLAVGVLGGVLGGLLSVVIAHLLVAAGVTAALGVALPAGSGPLAFGEQAVSGAFWGVAFGVLYPWVPGGHAVTRGLVFSLLPALHLLLNVYPLELELGWFGVHLGAFTFLFVFLFEMVWGVTTGVIVRWGEQAADGPISRPLGA